MKHGFTIIALAFALTACGRTGGRYSEPTVPPQQKARPAAKASVADAGGNCQPQTVDLYNSIVNLSAVNDLNGMKDACEGFQEWIGEALCNAMNPATGGRLELNYDLVAKACAQNLDRLNKQGSK